MMQIVRRAYLNIVLVVFTPFSFGAHNEQFQGYSLKDIQKCTPKSLHL